MPSRAPAFAGLRCPGVDKERWDGRRYRPACLPSEGHTPGEVITVTLTTPANARMTSNSFNFVHANGTVKPKNVPKIDVPKTE